MYKECVLNALDGHRIEQIATPLRNEFILDDEWLIEMDRDGAFAATISRVGVVGPYAKTHVLVVFSGECNELSQELETTILGQLNHAFSKLNKKLG